MADRSGETIEGYRLLRPLGGGAFGDVYLAEDAKKQQVAIKLLHGKLDNAQLPNFLREVNIGLSKHPHIVTVLGLGIEPTSSSPYIVMEYASKGTLLNLHSRGTTLPLATIILYVKQIAAALQFAHSEKNIIHRDVKPENILIDEHDILKLTDFGISAISGSGLVSLENNQQGNIQLSQGRAGTAWYMAPEQINSKPSRASDQYALAIIVYEWLTGEPPFIGGILEVWGQHLHATPDPLPKSISMLSDELEVVVMRALSKDSKARYSTIQDFATALEAAYNKEVQRRSPKVVEPPKLPTLDGKTREQWFEEGTKYYNAKKYKGAITAFSKAIELDPSDFSTYYTRGYLLYNNFKRYDEALQDYSKLIELDPSDASAYYRRGNLYRDLKRYDEALQDYSKLIELDPSDASAYYRRGNLYYDLERYEEVLQDYSKAIELNPTKADTYCQRGYLYHYHLNRHEEALYDYNKAIELNPSNANNYIKRGDIYRYINPEEALRDYSKAIELNPSTSAYYSRGDLYCDFKRYDEALCDYSKVIELDPSTAAYYSRGDLYRELERYEEALQDYSKVIELNPSDANAYAYRGDLYRDLKRDEEALRDYNNAIEQNPSYTDAYHKRGNLYSTLKNYKQAIADYDHALALEPDNATVREYRERAFKEMKKSMPFWKRLFGE